MEPGSKLPPLSCSHEAANADQQEMLALAFTHTHTHTRRLSTPSTTSSLARRAARPHGLPTVTACAIMASGRTGHRSWPQRAPSRLGFQGEAAVLNREQGLKGALSGPWASRRC
jgi:hypothetical protein